VDLVALVQRIFTVGFLRRRPNANNRAKVQLPTITSRNPRRRLMGEDAMIGMPNRIYFQFDEYEVVGMSVDDVLNNLVREKT